MPETNAQLSRLLSAVATLTDEVQSLKTTVAILTTSVDETKQIVEAWEAVKVGGKFIKWLGSIATAFAALWVLLRVGISHYLPGGKG